mgnify:CR=1 FL=1
MCFFELCKLFGEKIEEKMKKVQIFGLNVLK